MLNCPRTPTKTDTYGALHHVPLHHLSRHPAGAVFWCCAPYNNIPPNQLIASQQVQGRLAAQVGVLCQKGIPTGDHGTAGAPRTCISRWKKKRRLAGAR
mmetsp:Transcript_32078/g.46937  ORF Transcript_32078/g.46937 Transcript_32078/m.46937 type:complete len:99 (-) Transcript_32078:491-787(-)